VAIQGRGVLWFFYKIGLYSLFSTSVEALAATDRRRYDPDLARMNSMNLKFKIFAYVWTKIYIAPVYLISFLVPYLKSTIKNYEKLGDRKSIFLISSISGLLFSFGFYYIGDQLAVGGLAFLYLAPLYLGSLI
jgi:hypothetical protein